jgi:hypothetical protein
MYKLIIEDSNFSHSTSTSWNHKPEKFVWDRNINQDFEKIIITNLYSVGKYPNKKVYGWILEPPAISPNEYNFAKTNYNRFEKIFTYSKELLELNPKFDLLPIGGCWIDNNDQKIYEKNKLVSYISSTKNFGAPGHKLREDVRKSINNKVDSYGKGHNDIEYKLDGLKDYMFSIVIENSKFDYYFTEKIIDCFITGTIPIYWGCPSIDKFFNKDGLFIFNTIEELQEILSNINEEVYFSKINAIRENFNLSKKYTIADNLVFEKFIDN